MQDLYDQQYSSGFLTITMVGHNPESKRLQYPLIKESSLNYSRIPSMIQGIFLNYGILESLG